MWAKQPRTSTAHHEFKTLKPELSGTNIEQIKPAW